MGGRAIVCNKKLISLMAHLAVGSLLITLFVASDLQRANITQKHRAPGQKSSSYTTRHSFLDYHIRLLPERSALTTSVATGVFVCFIFRFIYSLFRFLLANETSMRPTYRGGTRVLLSGHIRAADRRTSTQEIGCVRGANSGA